VGIPAVEKNKNNLNCRSIITPILAVDFFRCKPLSAQFSKGMYVFGILVENGNIGKMSRLS
jgi:hypothetical protein